MFRKNPQPILFKDVWITLGIFSNHYLLERLPQEGPKSGLHRNKISIDPSDRKKQEFLEKHFTKSMSVLEPFKKSIKETDELIDDIVYEFYGLMPEEIEIVEGIFIQGFHFK